MFGRPSSVSDRYFLLPPTVPAEEIGSTTASTNEGSGQSSGSPYMWKTFVGGEAHANGQADSIASCMFAIKNSYQGLDALAWFIYKDDVLVDSGTIKYEEEPIVDTGGTGGATGQAGGSTGGETGGAGEAGAVMYRYRLIGLKWVWDNQDNENPMYWTGASAEYDITVTGYTYGKDTDAMTGARAVGDADARVVKIAVEASISGFSGLAHIYTDRYQSASNEGSKTKSDAVTAFLATHHWNGTAWVVNDYDIVDGTIVLPPGDTTPPATPGLGNVDLEAIAALAATVLLGIAIVLLAWYMLKGKVPA